MTRRRFVVLLGVIAAASFAGRAVYILAVTDEPLHFSDQLYYRDAAVMIAEGHPFRAVPPFGPAGWAEAEHPPLTALVLTPAAWLTDNSELAMRFTVALAGVAAVVLIGLLGAEVAGREVGVAAAALAAVYPNLWANDGLIMSETFAALGTAATLLVAYRLLRTPTWRIAALAGLMAGLTMLGRGEEVLLVPLLLVPTALMVKQRSWPERLRLAGVAVVASAVTIAPWVGYNLTRFDKPVLLSYGDGGVLLGANCADTYGGTRIGGWDGFCTLPLRAHDLSVDGAQKRSAAIRYARRHLGRLPSVVAARIGREWTVYRTFQTADTRRAGDSVPTWVTYSGMVTFYVLAGLAVWGAVLLRRRRVPLFPVLAPIGIVTLVAVLFYGSIRYRVPAEVSIVVLAAVALRELLPGARRDRGLVERRAAGLRRELVG